MITGSVSSDLSGVERAGLDARLKELYSLSAEIVDLFHTQAFSPDTMSTPADVCSAFSDMILRRWDLCCIVVYLRGEGGRLEETAINVHEHFDVEKARTVGAKLASEVESRGEELQAWVDNGGEVEGINDSLRSMLEDAGLRAAIAVPIHAQGALVGVLVAVTVFPERLREALNGIRYVAAPVVIGVSNSRRVTAMRGQHERIGQLVEQLQEHGRALEEANRELRRVAHYRSLFLRRMSHELRTPLTSILGFAEILLDEELTDTHRRFCEKIQSSGLQLQTSLNQLVDLSRLEAGQSELFLHEFSLGGVLKESCAAVARLAHRQGVKIECEPDPKLAFIVSDEGKLRQVLYNFLAHAISRSPEGEAVRVRSESHAGSRFRIVIEDDGEPPADISHIFEPVEICPPSENAATMNELGLAISRRLIDLLGGTVKLEPLKPRGLRVMIELPVRPTEGR